MSFETYRISAPIGMLLWTLVTTLFLSGDSTRSLPPQAVELASLFLKNSSFRQLYSDREGVDRKEQFEALEVRVVNELVVELKRISYQLFPAHEADDIAAEAYVMLAQFLLVREPDCLKLESVTAKERLLMTRDLFAFSSRMNDLFSVQSLCVALGTRGQLEVPAANPTPQPSEEEAAHHDMTTLSQGMEIHTHHLPEPCRKLMEHNLNGPLRHDESTPVDGNGIPAAMYERVLPILSSPEFQACVDMYEAPSGTAGSMESTRIQATELASKLQEYIVRTLKMSPFNPATSEKLAQILLQFIPDCLMQEMDPSTQKSPNAPSPAIDMPRLLVTAPNAQMLRELCRTITGHHAVAMQQQDVDENGHAHPRDPLPAGVMDGEPNEWFGGELAHSAITVLPFSPIPPHNMMQQRQHRRHGEEGAVKSEDMQGTDMVVHEHPHHHHPHPHGEEGAVKSEDMQGTDMVVHEHPHHPHPHGEKGAVKSEDMQGTDMDGGVAEETLIHHAAKLMQQVLPETMNIDKDTIQAHLRALRNTLIAKLQASGGTPPAEAETGVVQEALIPEMPSEPNVQPLNADEQVVKNSFAVMSDVVQNAPRYPVGATSNEMNTSLTTLNIVLVVCLGISLLALVAVVIRMRQQRSSGCDNQYSNEISEGLYSKMGNSEC